MTEKPIAGDGPATEKFGLDEYDSCTACGMHFSQGHTPGCPADPDPDEVEESVWLSSRAIQALIRRLALAIGATSHGPAEWGDRNADADVVTSPEAYGIVTVSHDNVREAITHPVQPMAVYVYRMPRRRRRTEHIADYAYEAMCDADGANREPVEVAAPATGQAIADALASLTH